MAVCDGVNDVFDLLLLRGRKFELVDLDLLILQPHSFTRRRDDDGTRLTAQERAATAVDAKVSAVIVLPLAAFDALVIGAASLRDPIGVFIAVVAVPRLHDTIHPDLTADSIPPVGRVEFAPALAVSARYRRGVERLDSLREVTTAEGGEQLATGEVVAGLQWAVPPLLVVSRQLAGRE